MPSPMPTMPNQPDASAAMLLAARLLMSSLSLAYNHVVIPTYPLAQFVSLNLPHKSDANLYGTLPLRRRQFIKYGQQICSDAAKSSSFRP